jgi:hypothetical protein
MKAIKYFLLAMVAFLAVSCADEMYTPRDGGGEDDDPPIIIGGGGTGGSGGSGGSGGGGSGRLSGEQKNQQDSVIHVTL